MAQAIVQALTQGVDRLRLITCRRPVGGQFKRVVEWS